MLGRLKRLLGKNEPDKTTFPTDLMSDPRWKRLHDSSYKCACCDASLTGIYDITFDHPDHWPHGNRHESGEEVLQCGTDRLSSELCEMIDDDYAVRCVLPLPIQGSDETFHFGCWASMSKASFDLYRTAVATGDYTNFEGCFGWIVNDLPSFPRLDVAAFIPSDIYFIDNLVRPKVWVHQGSHPLGVAQREGISFDRLLDIYAASGNDMRPHLLDS